TPRDDGKALRPVLPFFEKEGADAWYTHSAEELLPPGTRCAKCGQARWRKESDILDVWFDSGSTHLAVLDPARHARSRSALAGGPLSRRAGPVSRLVPEFAAYRRRRVRPCAL